MRRLNCTPEFRSESRKVLEQDQSWLTGSRLAGEYLLDHLKYRIGAIRRLAETEDASD